MFAILFEVLLTENQEEIHHFAGWEGGGLSGAKIVNKNYVNKLAFPNGFWTSFKQWWTSCRCVLKTLACRKNAF